MNNKEILKSKFRGGMLGLACGDALGATLEFLPKRAKRSLKHKDIIGGGLLKWRVGETTDDTSMTLAVAEGILDNPRNPYKSIGDRFVKWYKSNPVDIGHTCRDAIKRYTQIHDWETASCMSHYQSNEMSAGNGSLMRTLPISLVYHSDKFEMLSLSKSISEMTHYDQEASDACGLYNRIIWEIIENNISGAGIIDMISKDVTYSSVLGMAWKDLNPSGYVVDTFRCVLWAFINTKTFEDCLLEAVNLQGDSDTVGAIAGGLAGVYYGVDAIPSRWLDKLILKAYIEETANNLFSASQYYENITSEEPTEIKREKINAKCKLYDPRTNICYYSGCKTKTCKLNLNFK